MKHFKRPLAWILSLSMVASYIPPSYAQESDNTAPIPEETAVISQVLSESTDSAQSEDSDYTYADFRADLFDGVVNATKSTASVASISDSISAIENHSAEDCPGCILDETLYPRPTPGTGTDGAGFQSGSGTTIIDDASEESYPSYGFGTDDTNEITIYYDNKIATKEGTAQLVAQGEHSNFWVIEEVNLAIDADVVVDGITRVPTKISTDYGDLFDNATEGVDGAPATATATEEKLLDMVEYVDNIYKKMTAISPHANTTVEAGYDNMPLVGDVDGDGRINVILYDFGHHTSTIGYFSSACYFTECNFTEDSDALENQPLDAVHMDFNGFDSESGLPDSFYGTFAHELQHLMYYTYLGVFLPLDMDTTWINESLSGVPDMYYADGSALEEDSNNMNEQDLSVGRMAPGTVNSYENGDTYGDFVNFNGSSKNYGMSYMFSAFMTELDSDYYTKMYQYFQKNVEGKSFAEGQDVYEEKTMEELFGEAFQYVLGEMGNVSTLDAETVFEYVYTAFMESYISGGGDVILADGSKILTPEITKAPYATLWSSRNGNVAIIEKKDNNYYSVADPNPLYPTLYSSSSDSNISLSAYGTWVEADPDTVTFPGATHEMVYILDTTNYVVETEDETANYLKITVEKSESTGFLAYVALYETGNTLHDGTSFNATADINNDHADIYPLTLGESRYIKVESEDIVPHLFVVSYFGDVESSASFEWVSMEDILGELEEELGLDDTFTAENNEITVQTGEDDLDTLFVALNSLAEKLEATVTYYKSKSTDSASEIATISEGDDWVEIEEEEGGESAEEQAKEHLETAGNQEKVEYTFGAEGTSSISYTLVAESGSYEITLDFEDTEGKVSAEIDGDTVAKAEENDTITIIIEPETGYQVDEVTATYGENGEDTAEVTDEEDGTYTFTMPADHVEISVTFQLIEYTITLEDIDSKEGSATVKTETVENLESATMGEEITITVEPETGYQVDEVTVTYGEDEDSLTVDVLTDEDKDGTYSFTMPADHVEISVTFKEIEYTISFKYAEDQGTVTDDTGADLPTSANKDGEISFLVEPKTGYVVEAVTVTYEEDGDSLTVDFDEDDGTYTFEMPAFDVTIEVVFAEIPSISLDYGEYTPDDDDDLLKSLELDEDKKIEVSLLPDLEDKREGYTFRGWYTKNKDYEDGDKVTADTTFDENDTIYAIWEIISYDVSFDLNYTPVDEETTPATEEVEHGGTVEKPTDPERTGYEFKGWSDDEDADPDYFTAWDFDSDVVTEDTKLFAVWEILSYEVTFVYGDNETDDYTENVEHGGTVKKPTEPTRTGYDFVGWSDDEDTTPDSFTAWDFDTVIEDDTELFAIWKIIRYTITLSPDEEEHVTLSIKTGGDDYVSLEYGILTLTTDDAWQITQEMLDFVVITEKEGYEFVGWYSDSGKSLDLETVYTDHSKYYAVVEEITYTVTFDYNGYVADGGETSEEIEVSYFTPTVDESEIPEFGNETRTGYDFVGWYAVPVPEEGDDEWNFETEKITDDTTIYAVWEAETYDIFFTVSFADLDGAQITATIDSIVAAYDGTLSTPTISGYSAPTGYYVAWFYTDGDNNNVEWDFKNDTVSGEMTLSASLEKITYTVTLDYQDDDGKTKEVFVKYEDTFENTDIPTNPTRTGYDFVGWYADSKPAEGATTWDFETEKITDDTTIYAVWKIGVYTVTIVNTTGGSLKIGEATDNLKLTTDENWNIDLDTVDTTPDVGYDFVGWFDAETGGNEVYSTTVFTEDTTIYAQWKSTAVEAVTFEITLDENLPDGTGSTTIVETDEDGTLTSSQLEEPSNAPEGYDFTGWFDAQTGGKEVDSTTVFTKNTIIYAIWEEDNSGTPPETGDTYTITLISGENGTITKATLVTGTDGKITQDMLDEVEKTADTGYQFKGWYTDEDGTETLDLSTVYTENASIYGIWEEISGGSTENEDPDTEDPDTEDPETETPESEDPETDVAPEDFSLWGKIMDSNGENLENVTISLKQNGKTYETVTSNAYGNYYFSGSYTGYYNLVFIYGGMTKTVAVYLASSSTTISTISMPSHSISTILGISSKTYVDAVAGLDSLADMMSNTLKTTANLEMEITSSTSTENQDLIETVLGRDNEVISYFDVDLYQRTYTDSTLTSETALTETDSLLQIFLEIPSSYQDLDQYFVYRLHDSDLDILSTVANSQNERIVLGADGKTLTIYTRNFSTYAFVCETESTGSSGVTGTTYPVIIDRLADGVSSSSAAVGTVGFSTSNPATGALVTVTPYPGVGYALDSVTASTEDGSSIYLVNRGDGSYTFVQGTSTVTLTVAFVTEAEPVAPAYTMFNDVGVMDPKCSAINKVVELGLMSGLTSYTFAPNDSLTRGMLVAILYKLSGSYSYGSGHFSDVKTTDYYYNAVAWAKEIGIVSGYSDGTFRPNQAVSRQELAVIFDSYCTKTNLASYVWLFPNEFTDQNSIASWANTSVNFCTNLGIMDSSDDFFRPTTYATRGEVAVSLVALYEYSS